MALAKVSGQVSNFREETEVKSATSTTGAMGMGRTTFRTEKVINFRVGNRPVTFKLPKGIDLTDGDEATVIGTESSSGIKAVLVRNDGTGIVYGMSFGYVLFWAIALFLIGFVTAQIFIGYVLLGLGVYLGYKALQLKQAQGLLSTA